MLVLVPIKSISFLFDASRHPVDRAVTVALMFKRLKLASMTGRPSVRPVPLNA